jgi:hypothetical protein
VSSAGSTPSSASWVGSVVALGLGVVLSVAVSALFAAFGWGGELASQTAGATSGAAPLLIDALRVRRLRRAGGGPDVPAVARSRGDWPRKLLVASCFAFALLLLESAWGWFVFHLARWAVRVAHADPARFQAVYTLLGGIFLFPVVLSIVYLLALAAGRRLREHRRRWILLGMGVYAVVRVVNAVVALTGPRTDGLDSVNGVTIIAGFVVGLPLMCGIALLGVRRARRTQAAFDASVFFRRLQPADREAALALLHDAQPARTRTGARSRATAEQAPAEPLR